MIKKPPECKVCSRAWVTQTDGSSQSLDSENETQGKTWEGWNLSELKRVVFLYEERGGMLVCLPLQGDSDRLKILYLWERFVLFDVYFTAGVCASWDLARSTYHSKRGCHSRIPTCFSTGLRSAKSQIEFSKRGGREPELHSDSTQSDGEKHHLANVIPS